MKELNGSQRCCCSDILDCATLILQDLLYIGLEKDEEHER